MAARSGGAGGKVLRRRPPCTGLSRRRSARAARRASRSGGGHTLGGDLHPDVGRSPPVRAGRCARALQEVAVAEGDALAPIIPVSPPIMRASRARARRRSSLGSTASRRTSRGEQ